MSRGIERRAQPQPTIIFKLADSLGVLASQVLAEAERLL
jgi:hypothetical protein